MSLKYLRRLATTLLFFSVACHAQLTPVGATASQTAAGSSPSLAIDGNSSTFWNSGGNATQWIQVDLGALYSLTSLDLRYYEPVKNTSQTTITGLDAAGNLVATFGTVTTGSKQIVLTISNQPSVRYVRAQINQFPGTVAVTDFVVYGAPPPPPPTVSIGQVSPNNGQTVSFGNVELSVSATDSSGAHPTVAFYANGGLLATLTTPPYQVSYNPSTAGIYTFTAVASNSYGSQASSTSTVAVEQLVPVVQPVYTTSPTFEWNSPYVDYHNWYLPQNQWYVAVRGTNVDPTTTPFSTDASEVNVGNNYCAFPLGGGWCDLTGFVTPTPHSSYQVGQVDGDLNSTSVFQQYGTDVGSVLNTWESGCVTSSSGGVQMVFEYRPSPGGVVFDGDANTALLLQADMTVPWAN